MSSTGLVWSVPREGGSQSNGLVREADGFGRKCLFTLVTEGVVQNPVAIGKFA
jgi:hypothetical protein